MSNEIILLFVLLFTCHWLADYTPLSTPKMLKAKSTGGPLYWIFLHGAVHGVLMSSVVALFVSDPWMIGAVFATQTLLHYFIDLGKAMFGMVFPSVKDSTKYFHWIIFGFDQLLHNLVILAIVKLVSKSII
jgi:hypothetical protein